MQYSTLAVTFFAGLAAAHAAAQVSAPAGSPSTIDCPKDQLDTLNQCLQNTVSDSRFTSNCIKAGANDYTCMCQRARAQQVCYQNSCPSGGGLQTIGGQVTQFCALGETSTSSSAAASKTKGSDNAGSESKETPTGTEASTTATGTEAAASASSSAASGAEALSISYALLVAPVLAYFAM